MMHDRTWSLSNVEGGARELAEKLKESATWTNCTGFRLGDVGPEGQDLWALNDSTAPGRAQEFAIVDPEAGRQLESLTVSWTDIDRLEELLKKCIEERYDDPMFGSVDPEVEPINQHG